MSTLIELYPRILTLVGIVVLFFLLYELIRMFLSKAYTYMLRQNGVFEREGLVSYNRRKDTYMASDLRRGFADRQVGEVYVDEDRKAWVQVKKEDSDLPSGRYERIGYIDLTGNVFDKNHCHVGYVGITPGQPDMNGKRKWTELFLRCHANVYLCARQEQILSNAGDPDTPTPEDDKPEDICIGKCIETGRFRNRKSTEFTALGRAAAFLLLYQYAEKAKPVSEEHSIYYYGWSSTALVSTFVYAILYTLFYLLNFELIRMPFLGDELGFVVASTAFYGLVWAIVRQVMIEQSLSGKPVEHFLMLFNRNTGLSGLNYSILFFTVVAIFASIFFYGGDFLPLQLAILIGVWVNSKYVTRANWIVHDRFFLPLLDESWEEEEEAEGKVAKTYAWELDPIDAPLSVQGELTLHFVPEEIEELRDRNPFRTDASQDFDTNIEQLFRTKINERHLKRINRYIAQKAYDNGLSGLDTMQFILDFVQEPNIKYLSDAESVETGGQEYARFPVETLFDKHGDCDCKAVLAAALYRNAGYKVAYITSNSHAAIAVACPEEWFKYYRTGQLYASDPEALLSKDGLYYYFCETTGDSFRIGQYGSGTTPVQFTHFKFLL